MASARSRLPPIAAAGFLAVATAASCGLVQNVDDISQSGGAAGSGGTQVASTVATGGSSTATTSAGNGGAGAAGSTVASTTATTMATGCVDPPSCGNAVGDPCCVCGGPPCGANLKCDAMFCQPCGAEGQPCCMGQCNPGQLVCDGTDHCVQCGDVPEPCCPGPVCNGEWPVCQSGTCLHCCVLCQGDGTGDPTQGAGKAVNTDDNGYFCPAAATQYCKNLKGCNGPSPAPCCPSSCVNDQGWGPCQP